MTKQKSTNLIVLALILLWPILGFGQQAAQNLIIQDMNYLIYFPQEYSDTSNTKWPLLIFLHGMGETGTDINKVKHIGLAKNIEEGQQLPFIVISPQEQRSGSGWDINTLYNFFNKIIEKYPVDQDRVYLTGLSMGGYGTWNFAAIYPDLFAAIIPICGGTHYPNLINRLKDIPVWCFHGDQDTAVPLSASQNNVDTLKQHNGNVKFTIYPGVGHDSWTQTYANEEIYEWLLQQKRSKNIPIELNEAILQQYTGEYKAENSDYTLRFEITEGKLKLWINDQEGPLLNAVSKNEFYHNEYVKNYITFHQSPQGETTGVTFMGSFLAKQ